MDLDLCIPHQCQCGSPVDARGLHSFVCRRAPGRSARHHALNDLVARCFASAGIPVTKEPIGLFRTDGKRPDGLTLVPWQIGKSLCWDVTVICPLAESYVTGSAREAGAAAKLAASRKEEKYARIGSEYLFAPIAVKTLGPMNTLTRQLLANLGRKISSASGDDREGAFLFQRVSVLVQRYNAVLLHDTVPATDCTGLMICTKLCIILIFKLPQEHIYRGLKIQIIIMTIPIILSCLLSTQRRLAVCTTHRSMPIKSVVNNLPQHF